MDWETLLSTFGLIFVAELGDKTQLAVVTQTCKYRRPWSVFLGASLALAAVTVIGALGGHLLGQIVPESIMRGAAALAFVVMGILIGREALKTSNRQAELDAACMCDMWAFKGPQRVKQTQFAAGAAGVKVFVEKELWVI